MGLKMNNFNNMGVHQFLGVRGVTQKEFIGVNCLKRGIEQFAWGLVKKREEGVFEGGRVDTAMHTMT